MNVLAVSDYLNNVGGAELSTREILVRLATADGVDSVTVVGIDEPNADRLDYPGVEVVAMSPPAVVNSLPDYLADLVLARVLARKIEANVGGADLVHAHHRRSTLALAHVESPVPTASTIRDFWPICPISTYSVDGEQCTGCVDNLDACVRAQGLGEIAGELAKPYLLLKRRNNRRGFLGVDCAVFIAEHLRETVGASVSLPERTDVIYNPVSIADDPIAPERDVDLVTASSLTRDKGVETAIRAVARVADDVSGTTLDVFGDGPRADELEALAGELGIADAVRFRGRRPLAEVYGAMAAASATVFPSVWAEPFGRITVESMMLETPVVGSDVGGIAEIVAHDETGLLFPPEDDVALAERLQRLLDEPELRDRLATTAEQRTAPFAPDAVAAAHRDLYTQLIQ